MLSPIGLSARAHRPGIVGANVGANKDSADRAADYVLGMGRVWQHASYVTANISSPNTPGLRGLQERGALEDLLGRLREARALLEAAHGRRPLFLKVAPDLDETRDRRHRRDWRSTYGLDALIVSNTTLQRPPHLTSDNREEAGGLSGQPLVSDFNAHAAPVRAGAGRALAADRRRRRRERRDSAGEDQSRRAARCSFTRPWCFEGPGLVARILEELDGLLMAEGFDHVSEAVGAER